MVFMNIDAQDAQDAQDKQDERLWRRKPAGAMSGAVSPMCGVASRPFREKILRIPTAWIRVKPRRRRQHLPSGASPKAAADVSEGRACGRDARAPGGHDPFRQQFPHPPEFCKASVVSGKSKDRLRDLAIPSRSTSTPWWPFLVLRVTSLIPHFAPSHSARNRFVSGQGGHRSGVGLAGRGPRTVPSRPMGMEAAAGVAPGTRVVQSAALAPDGRDPAGLRTLPPGR